MGNNMAFDNTLPITRVEVIDHSHKGEGRDFVRYYDKPIMFELDLQDDDRTLKIFIKDQDETDND